MDRRKNPKRVIALLADAGLEIFTLADLQAELALTAPQARQLAYRMARQNLVRRIRRGLYAILQPADWHDGPAVGLDRYWAAANAVRDKPYFFAYYTAMDLHRMVQQPLRTVFVAVRQQHRAITLGTGQVRFVTLAEGKFFGHEDRRTGQGHVVKIAQLERTFLDCADRPELCGGIEEVFRGFARRANDMDPDRLLGFARRLAKPVVIKRMGLLLELAGGDPELLLELERIAGRLKRFVPLDKAAPARGERNRRWELIVNADLHRLFAAART